MNRLNGGDFGGPFHQKHGPGQNTNPYYLPRVVTVGVADDFFKLQVDGFL